MVPFVAHVLKPFGCHKVTGVHKLSTENLANLHLPKENELLTSHIPDIKRHQRLDNQITSNKKHIKSVT